MTTPFSDKSPIIIAFPTTHPYDVGITTPPTGASLGINTSTITEIGVFFDWSKFSGSAQWHLVYGHAATSTAGNQIFRLIDITNTSTVLATASSATSTATNSFATAESTTITFTKPSSTAKVAILISNSDSTARSMILWTSWIVIA